jgi:hypothetical protein
MKHSLVKLTELADFNDTSTMLVQAFPKVFAAAAAGRAPAVAAGRQQALPPANGGAAPAGRGRGRSAVEDKAFGGK